MIVIYVYNHTLRELKDLERSASTGALKAVVGARLFRTGRASKTQAGPSYTGYLVAQSSSVGL